MPRKPRTFVGAYYENAWVFLAATKAEAGLLLLARIPADQRRKTTEKALARYVSPLHWCPKHQRLWFKRTVDATCPVLHPRLVPAALWTGIKTQETEKVAGYYPYSGGEGPVRVTAKQLQQRVKGTPAP